MLDILVAEIVLQSPRIVPGVRQRVSASVAQHMRMNSELEFGRNACTRDHLSEASGGEGRLAFRDGHEGRN
jgi:hypothetical protein